MTTEERIKLMEDRLQKLESSEKENFEVCRRIKRDIRNLQKKISA